MVLCFIFCCGCLCSVSRLQYTMGWSAVGDCEILVYLLTFYYSLDTINARTFIEELTLQTFKSKSCLRKTIYVPS